MREGRFTATILLLLAIFLIGGCAKKAVRESEMGAAGTEVVTLPSEEEISPGVTGQEGIVSEETITPEEGIEERGISEEIEEALKELEEEEELARAREEAEGGRTGEVDTGEMLERPSYERLEGLTEEEKMALERLDEMVKEEGRLMPVYFDFDKYSLRDDARETLKKNALWLKANNHVKILIEGHADERGSNEYNLALGDKRAKSVLSYLRALGVDVEMTTISYGEERPVCYEHNEGCWWRNRRAEFRILSE